MAIGKNKKNYKKKAGKKKPVDPFTRKEWYDVKVPSLFTNRIAGKTPINRTAGQRVASEEMKGRVFEISLGDLNTSSDADFRKMRLVVEDVQGKDALCNFYGMDMTRDKLAGLFRKWQTTIEASVDVRTKDDYTVRLFAIAFTARQRGQKSKTTYAQTAKVRQIRKRMTEIMRRTAEAGSLAELFDKLIPEAIGAEITKQCREIFPLTDVFVRKAKMIKRPKFDLDRLMSVHGSGKEDTGAAVKRAADLDAGKVAGLASSGGRL